MNKYIIQTNNLSKKYGEKEIVKNLNMKVKKGTIYGLLGRNGAGKTTIMKMLLGLTKPSNGEIYIFGKNISNNNRHILPRIGSLIEAPGFYPNLTGKENLEIFASLRGIAKRDAVRETLKLVGLPTKSKKIFSEYSLGMKQRLAIGLAIMHDPEILILDEPTNGLDPIGISQLRKFLKNLCELRGKTIIISSHILSEISLLSDDIGIINDGKLLIESSLEELERKNKKYIYFLLSDTSQASRILEVKFKTSNFKIGKNGSLYLYDLGISISEINRAFVESGIDVKELYKSDSTLEDYFKLITGGGKIGEFN